MLEQDLQGQYAGFVSRLIAWLIDRGIILAILGLVGWLVTYLGKIVGLDITQCPTVAGWTGYLCLSVVGALVVFTLTFAPLYFMFFWTLAGMTPGKAMLGVRIVRLDGRPMTFRTSFRRYLGYVVSFLGFGAGYLWILVDNRRQGWHDKIADTCVVYSWSARQNDLLIDRMTDWLFRSRKRIDKYSEKLAGKPIYATHSAQEAATATDSVSATGGSDDVRAEDASAPAQNDVASPERETTTTQK